MQAERLLNGLKNGEFPHAILIAGAVGSGRAALARRAAAVYCLGEDAPQKLLNSPHVQELSGETVSVSEVRRLMTATAMRGFNGQKRAFVITDAHRMGQQSQNALLKTLEEPPTDTLLLLSGSEEGLLPTIRSRCMTVRLGAGSVQEVETALLREGKTPGTAALAAALSGGVYGRACQFAEEEYLSFRQTALTLFESALFGAAPFLETAALITVTGGDDGQAQEPEGKKRTKKADSGTAGRLLEIFESVVRDALMQKFGGETANIDAKPLINRVATRFTSGQIQGIIEICEQAQKRLLAKAAPRMTLDAVLAALHEKESTQR